LAAFAFRQRLGLPPDVVEHDIRRLHLLVDKTRFEFSGPRPTYLSFKRSVFDAFLAERARQAGAEVLTSTRAAIAAGASRRVELKNLESGRERQVQAQVIIFADGPRTLAADCCGIGYGGQPDEWRGLVVELEGPHGDGESVEIIVDSAERAVGYFWVFPKGEVVHVGFGVRPRPGAPPLLEAVSRFIEARPDLRGRRVLSKKASLIPCRHAERMAADGCMVVGDAAGLVNPVTGGGISFALRSGEIAGRVAAAAVKRGRTDDGALGRYPRRLRATADYQWLGLMGLWWGRLNRLDPAAQPAAYGRMLRRYFRAFHSLRSVADIFLG